MLKINLLTTTALVLIASTACATAQSGPAGDQSGNNGAAIASANSPAAQAVKSASAFAAPVANAYGCGAQMRAQLGKSGRNRNIEFLNSYGYRVCNYSFYDSTTSVSGWEDVASPIKGTGNMITKIMVKDCPVSHSPSFAVGVYKDYHRAPGSLIASGRATANSSCGWTSATIPRTMLKTGKRYWVVESNSVSRPDDINAVLWVSRRTSTRHNALYRYHHLHFSSSGNSNSNYTSPWLSVSGPRPSLKVK